MLVDGRTVPGLSVTPIRGESGPTMLEGEPVRHDDEVVLGVDTADRLGVEIGDEVQVQSGQRLPQSVPRPRRCRCAIVGLATFAAISQQGAGRGAARRRRARHPAHLRAAARLRREPARVDHGEPGGGHRPDGAHRRQPRRRRGRARRPDAVVHRCATRRAPAARRGLPGARRCRRGRAPAARRRARPGRLVADPGQRRRAVGAPGPRMLPRTSSPAPRRGSRFHRASPPWSSGSRSGSPSVDSPSAPSPDRSRWSTTRAHRPGSSWRWCSPWPRRSGAGALVAGQVARRVASAATLRDAEARRA